MRGGAAKSIGRDDKDHGMAVYGRVARILLDRPHLCGINAYMCISITRVLH